MRPLPPLPAFRSLDAENAERDHAIVTASAWWRRFGSRGVFWRQLLRFGVLNCPLWLEPLAIAWWSVFFLLWGSGRRPVMRNLAAIKPGSLAFVNFFRCYRVFWDYAWAVA